MCIILALVDAHVGDDLGEGVRRHVALWPLRCLTVHRQEAVKNADAINLALLVVAGLKSLNVDDALPVVLQDAIDEGEGPFDELRLSIDFLDDLEQGAEEFLAVLFVGVVKEVALSLVVQTDELADNLR